MVCRIRTDKRACIQRSGWLRMKDDSLFAFAGIWDCSKSRNSQLLESCSILTSSLRRALGESCAFISLSFGFGSIKLIVKPVQRGDLLARDAHELGVAEGFIGYTFEYSFDLHVLEHVVRMVRCAGKRDGWLFPSPRAEGGHLTTVAKQFRDARSKAGLSVSLVLCCARHTFGRAAYEATGNLAMVMNVMGHTDAYLNALPASGVG